MAPVPKEEARSFLSDADPKRNSELRYLGSFYNLGCQCPWRGHVLIHGIWGSDGTLKWLALMEGSQSIGDIPLQGNHANSSHLLMVFHLEPQSDCPIMWFYHEVMLYHSTNTVAPTDHGQNVRYCEPRQTFPFSSVDYLKFVLQYWKADSQFIDTTDLWVVKCNNIVCIWRRKF